MLIDNVDISSVSLELEDLRAKIKEVLAEGDEPQLTTCDFMIGKKPLRVTIDGTLSSRGITVKKTDFGIKHTIGVDIDDDAKEVMNQLLDLVNNVKGLDEEWDVKDIFFKNKWYPQLKLEEGNRRYKCITCPKLSPIKPNEDINKGTEVVIDTDIGAWFSISKGSKKAGVYFSFNKVTFLLETEEAEEEAPPKKKSKK